MRSTVVISTLLPLLLHLTPVTATYDKPLTLDRALRKYCLGKYADFIIKYPDPATNLTDIIVFAPTNKAVKEYLLANPDPIPDEPSTSSSKLNKRADPAKNTANKNNVATGASAATAFGSTPPKGSIIATGAGGAAGAKVVKPAGAGGSKRGNDWGRYDDHKDWDKGCAYDYHAYEDAKSIALISAGGGARTGVKAEGLTFNNGKIVVVDNFFAPAEDTGSYINSPDLQYLNKVFYRLPHYKKKIFESSTLTFLAPTADAFHKAGYSEYKSPEWALAKFLDDHTIRNGFIGYTPAFVDGKCYRTASYKGFVTSFDGTKTKVNDATIIQEDLIVNNGVIQVIDKVLHSGKKGYYPPEPCKKEWYGN